MPRMWYASADGNDEFGGREEDSRGEEAKDGLAQAIERYLLAWRGLTRENVQHACREANPLLVGPRSQRRRMNESPASSPLP